MKFISPTVMSGTNKKPPKGQNVFCKTCRVYISSGSEKSHMNGKKHRILEGVRLQRTSKAVRSIHVSRLPPNASDFELKGYFSNYGPVSSVRFPKNHAFCFVDFSCNVRDLNILKKKHVLRGRVLKVQQAIESKRSVWNPGQAQDDITKNPSVIENINPNDHIENQIKVFLHSVCLSERDLLEREKFVAYLTESVQSYIPGSRFEIFGSTANGFGFTGCDIDLSFFLPVERDESQIVTLNEPDVPKPQDIISGQFPRRNLLYLSKQNLLEFLLRHVKSLPGITRVQLIPFARCPIFKFEHKGPKIRGDISFEKSLGIANSNLLRLYGRLDHNVYALLIVLRFWAKREGLVGSNHMITSYAFSWLVIFYLQHRHLLPTVETLAALAEYKTQAEKWDCTFTENLNVIPVETRGKTFIDLILGFFEFYVTFDFTVQVICPRDGSTTLKSVLASMGDELDFRITSMSVQDVFDLTHNITASVNDKTLQCFLSKCNTQLVVWQTMVAEGNINLKNLFHLPSVEPVAPTPAPTPAPFNEPSLLVTLPEEILGTNSYGIDDVCNLLLDILKRAFLFECTIRKVSPSLVVDSTLTCVKKIEGMPIRKLKTTEDELILLVFCEALYRTWEGRKTVKGFVSMTDTVKQLDIEENIARELVKKHPYKDNPPILHTFEVAVFLCQNTPQMKVSVSARSPKKELFFTVIPLVKKYIDKLMEAYLKQWTIENVTCMY